MDLLKNGGLMVVPSAPGLATIGSDLRYTEAVKSSDFAIPDSGYMVLLLKIFKGIKINKFSGNNFLKQFFNDKSIEKTELFLIDPNENESKLNYKYLCDKEIVIDSNYQYVAPIYGDGPIEDEVLINKLNNLIHKPKYIIINLGSGIQEPLGLYLKQNLNFNPGIICTGAAIAFQTGAQAKIPPLIDKIYFGWFWRCITNPLVYIPRYFFAIKLIKLILEIHLCFYY